MGERADKFLPNTPVWGEVGNPSSSDRTPPAGYWAEPRAAAIYRASGLVLWHISEELIRAGNVSLVAGCGRA